MDDIQFMIPDYQRAYSWGDEQYKDFFDDLYEQSKGENKYFFGNFLIEENSRQSMYEIVDGQQRITTIIIFINSILSILEERIKSEPLEINIDGLRNIYIGSATKAKLVPTKTDRLYFDNVIINNRVVKKTSTQSQEKIKNAKNYFSRKLKTIKITELLRLLKKLEESIVTVTIIDNKTDAAFMFELQNNRGKEITSMEQVKAYLMYQVYIKDAAVSVNQSIEKLSAIFEDIYLSINNIRINEDDLLWYHCNAYYGYKYIDDNYEFIPAFLKKHIGKISEKKERINFINTFALDLKRTFADIERMESDKTNIYIKRLRVLGIPSFQILYPLIIKGYLYNSYDEDYLKKFFRIIELLAFRISLIRTNGNVKITNRLDAILDFNGDLNKLYQGIKTNFAEAEGEWRWTDDAMQEVLHGPFYGKVTDNILHYILKIYENHISEKECPILKNIWIEHISPQSPPQRVDSGYELTKQLKYSKKFESQYLDCIGNLLLSTDKQNRELSNKIFKDKLKIYKNNTLGLKQQCEIKEFVTDNKFPQWGISEIEKRKITLIDFIMKEWGFEEADKIFITEIHKE
jgi:hypothetical protein